MQQRSSLFVRFVIVVVIRVAIRVTSGLPQGTWLPRGTVATGADRHKKMSQPERGEAIDAARLAQGRN
jgi:hypothetical protein